MPEFSMTSASIALLFLSGLGGYAFSKVMVIFNLMMWTNHPPTTGPQPLLPYGPPSSSSWGAHTEGASSENLLSVRIY